ncbi:B3 domain-containing transcription factor VRN1-like [Pistacia vera]|uniref:B3 domain-containing transcription factor VRN1-like n=1 Tax=Pistacia vera TaxID=55513 RepID=UPI0012637D79|nr:B3 domain-containing transcription factor VRN1-like [Pistacia vera]
MPKIPVNFLRKFGNELSDVVTLKVLNGRVWFADELSAVAKLSIPNGHVWQVTIDGKNIWFQDGWHDFVQSYSVSTGYFLVFKYAKNSTFQVLIFYKTACEIQYPYNAEEAVNDVENSKFRPPSKKFKIEEMGIYIAGKNGLLSIKQRKRAIDIARLFKPRNPFVHVYLPRACMHVPIKFVNKYISSKARFITLQISNEKEWLVRIKKFNTGGFRITKGWARFLKDNDLKGGDICIFELMIRKKDYLTLKVLVYHAAMKLT